VNPSGGKVNAPLLIASLIISFVLWAAVYAQNLPVNTRSFEIDLLRDGLATDRYAIVKADDKLRVYVTGSDQQMNEVRDAQKYGRIDLSGAAPGERMYPVELQPPLFRDLAHDAVPEVRIAIEEVSRRRLRVAVESVGQLKSANRVLGNLVAEPSAVTISGPESLVKEAAEARVTFDLGEADPRRAEPHNLLVEVIDGKGRRIESGLDVNPKFVGVTPVLVPSPERKTASVLVRFKGRPAPGYETAAYLVEPDSVTLVGPSFALASVSSVNTQPIDVTGLTEPKEFKATLSLPAGVTAARPNQVTVRVIIRKAPNGPSAPAENPPPTNP
jgi:YbbR domain-containing protein